MRLATKASTPTARELAEQSVRGDLFIEARSDVWSAFDALWIGLAVVTAFRIPAVPRTPAEEPAAP